jgi:hypothetical protein
VIRCKKCKRFTRNNVALRGLESIKSARGDCSRCGPEVEVNFDAWEDWGWSDEDEDEFFDKVMNAAPGARDEENTDG